MALGPFAVVPPGVDYEVTVTLRFGRERRRFRPQPAPRRVRGTGPGWYRGDCHLHTVHSDGRHTQASLAALAQEAGLDFIGLGPTNGVSLGLMLESAMKWSSLYLGMWWWFIPPGLGITMIVGSLYILNVGLDEVFNPKLREL